MAKSQLFTRPIQFIYTHGGVFPVRRGQRDEEAFKTADAILKRGGLIVMYAEAGRSRSGELGSRGRASGRLALQYGVPIVPDGDRRHRAGAQLEALPVPEGHRSVRRPGRASSRSRSRPASRPRPRPRSSSTTCARCTRGCARTAAARGEGRPCGPPRRRGGRPAPAGLRPAEHLLVHGSPARATARSRDRRSRARRAARGRTAGSRAASAGSGARPPSGRAARVSSMRAPRVRGVAREQRLALAQAEDHRHVAGGVAGRGHDAGRCRRRTGRSARPNVAYESGVGRLEVDASASRRRGRTGVAQYPLHAPARARPPPTRRLETTNVDSGNSAIPLAWSEWRWVITTTVDLRRLDAEPRAAVTTRPAPAPCVTSLITRPGESPERLVRRHRDRGVEAGVHEHRAGARDAPRGRRPPAPAAHLARGTPIPSARRLAAPALLAVHGGGWASTIRPHRSGRSRTVAPWLSPGQREGGGPGLGGGRHRGSPYPGARVLPGARPPDRLGYAPPCPPAPVRLPPSASSRCSRRGAVAPGAAFATARPPQGPPPGVDLTNADRCDFLDPAQCLFPWPNDYFTVRDRHTETGRRVNLQCRLDAA